MTITTLSSGPAPKVSRHDAPTEGHDLLDGVRSASYGPGDSLEPQVQAVQCLVPGA